MFNKIKIILGTLLCYLLGYRAFEVYAKWKSFDNEIVPFDTVLLKKNVDIHSGSAIVDAISQVSFFEIFKNSYTFDHLEPTSIFNYINNAIILC